MLGALFVLVILRQSPIVQHKLFYSILRQKTTAGRDAGKPIILAAEQTFSKNDLLAILVDPSEKGFLYAFQRFSDGSFEVLYPSSPGLASVPQAQQTRLPQEADKWLGFLSSSVTLVWSPKPVAELEAAISNSEIEEEDIRTIRAPEAAQQLDALLNTLSSHTHRNVILNPSPRSELSSADHRVAYRIQIQVE